jgi:hypothetical protein
MLVETRNRASNVEQVKPASAAQNAWVTTYSVHPVSYPTIDAPHFTLFRYVVLVFSTNRGQRTWCITAEMERNLF